MPIRVTCPQCGASGMAPDNLAGKKVRCQKCAGPIAVAAKGSAKGDAAKGHAAKANKTTAKSTPGKAPPAKVRDRKWLRWSIVCGPVIWLGLGWGWALAMPWLGLTGEGLAFPLHYLPLIVTLLWIGGNTYLAGDALGRTGRSLSVLPLAVVQLGLFMLLFFQIASHLGSQHYVWENSPGAWDWPKFALAHLAHAADLGRFLEAYGVDLGTIQPQSLVSSAGLVLFHLVFGLYFLGVAIEFIEPVTFNLFRQLVGWWITLFVVFFLAWVVTVEFFRPWQRMDMLLWWVDNLVRVVDVADVMDIARLQLHAFPKVTWEGTLTVICRGFLALTLLSLLSLGWLRLRVRQLGGWGVSQETLEDQVDIYSKAALLFDAQRLLEERAQRPAPRKGAWERLSWKPRLTLAALAVLLPLTLPLVQFAGLWNGPIHRLAETALAGAEPDKSRALAALNRLGPYAESAVPELTEGLAGLPADEQGTLLDTLGNLGQAGRIQLGQFLIGTDEELAHRALQSLQQSGPAAAPMLVQGTFAMFAPVRAASHAALENLGASASPYLIAQLTPENVWLYYRWLENDPAWYKRPSRNPLFADLCRIKDIQTILANSNDALALHQVAKDLTGLDRRLGLAALPTLQERIALASSQNLRVETTEGPVDALASLRQAKQHVGASPVAAVLVLKNALEKKASLPAEALQNIDAGDPSTLAKAIKELGPSGKDTVPVLEKMLTEEDNDIAHLALVSLRGGGFWEPADVAALVPLVRRPHPAIQQDAIQVLGQMGKAAAPAIPVLIVALKEKDADTRLAAAQSLGQIGAPAWTAIKTLRLCLKDDDARVVQQTAISLPKIHPQWKSFP